MKTTTNIAYSALILTATVGLSVSCKRKADNSITETKSLDNFAKTDDSNLTINSCGIKYTGKEKLSDKIESVRSNVNGAEEFRNTALGVMEAIPENLLNTFFALKGKITISSNATSLCRNVTLSPTEKEIAGSNTVVPACWRQSAPGQPPEIVLPENNDLIRHSLLRMFSYVFAEAFVEGIGKVKTGPFATTAAKDAAISFKAERRKLSTRFLIDLNALDRPEVYKKMVTFNKKDKDKFGNYVFAEAIDSYYCSDDTRKNFKSMFRKTWDRFTSTKPANSAVTLFGKK